jgi:hypothetical protein
MPRMTFPGSRLVKGCNPKARSNTGVTGISYCERGGRRFYAVFTPERIHNVSLNAFGRTEAWRQAVKIRADYETAVNRVRMCRKRPLRRRPRFTFR